MRIFLRVAGIVIAGMVLFAAVASVILFLHGEGGMYKVADRMEVVSPDGRYVASGYHVWGSAVVHDSTIFTLRQKQLGTDETNIMVVDMTGPKNPFAMRWADNTHLMVTYTSGSIYSKKSNWRDVQVSYDEK